MRQGQMKNLYYLFSVKDKFFTDLSLILANNHAFDSFYGLAYARTAVLKNPVFNHVSYVTDVMEKKGQVDLQFLSEIEQTYKVNISSMIHTDRHLSKYKKSKRLFIAQEMMRTLINDLDKFQITHVFPEGVDDFISYFAKYVCLQKGIKFFYSIEVGYGEKSCFSDSIYAEPEQFDQIFSETVRLITENQLDLSATKKELENYITAKKKPKYYLAVNEADYRIFKFLDLKIFFRYIGDYLKDSKALPYDRIPLFLPFYRLAKIFRKINYKKFIKKEAISPQKLNNVNYVIYPLHFEPEASTLIQGRWLHDQQKIIEIISKNLPVNTLLIVKEHRISIGRRSLKFYKDIVKHHNVFFVDDTVDTYSLIEKSKGVFVISSTMALEALMLKKPVACFGQRFYNVSKNVYVVDNLREIDKLIDSFLAHQFDETDCLAVFYSLFKSTQNMGNLAHNSYVQGDLHILAQAITQHYC